jgi:hypothetical protein
MNPSLRHRRCDHPRFGNHRANNHRANNRRVHEFSFGALSFGAICFGWFFSGRVFSGWVIAVLVSCSGCGSDVPFGIVPVHGKVTYEDGSLVPADEMMVIFNPVDPPRKGKMVAPGGRTSVDVADGTFKSVTSHRPNDGVVLGKHKVVVIASKKGPNGRLGSGNLVATKYRKTATTPVEVDVSSSSQFLEIKVSKQ